MPYIQDEEGSSVPEGLPWVIDAHVHIFPRGIFASIWRWFDQYAWPIRYRMTSSQVIDFLLSRGIRHVVALQYAHKPGIARELNKYMARKCSEYKGYITGMATVFPGEECADKILQEAFDNGLKGLKLHAHVQCFDMNSDEMGCIYECCLKNNKPIIMHIGREPKSSAYNCDPYEICSVDKLEVVLESFPGLRICVPHLGFDEIHEYNRLIEKYDNLWLDTTMIMASYFEVREKIDLSLYRAERLIYGSDFPNIPYAWDRELRSISMAGLSTEWLEGLCYKNAQELFSIDLGRTSVP